MKFSLRVERRKIPRMLAYEKMTMRIKEHKIRTHGDDNFFYPDCHACTRMETEIFKMQKARQERTFPAIPKISARTHSGEVVFERKDGHRPNIQIRRNER